MTKRRSDGQKISETLFSPANKYLSGTKTNSL